MENKLRTPGVKETILLTQRVSHQTEERVRIMGVLKSCSRNSSPLQTDPWRGDLWPHIRTRHVHSFRGSAEGVGLRKVSLEGLLVAPLPVPLPRYDEWVQLPVSKGPSLLFNFCSPQIKCHWSLWAEGESGPWVQTDFLQCLRIRSQPAPPHAHRLLSLGCWGSGCVRCTCCWQQRAACGSARTLTRSLKRTVKSARTEKRPRSGSTHLLPSYHGRGRSRGCVVPSARRVKRQGGLTLTRSEFSGSEGQWIEASQWPTSWSWSLSGCLSSGEGPWRCRCWLRTCGGCAGWSLSGGARRTPTLGTCLWGWRAETVGGSQPGTSPRQTPCDPGPCALTWGEMWRR